MKPDLFTRQRPLDTGLSRSRRHQQPRTRTLRLPVLVDREVKVQNAATRTVAMVVRRVEDRPVVRTRTADTNRLAGFGIDQPHPEMRLRRHFHGLPFRHDHVAPHVTRHDNVEKSRSVF